MKYPNIEIKKIEIEGIPALLLRPKVEMAAYPTVIFYHGWASNKDSQSFRGFILASLGYQVLIPDAIYHGDRDRIDHNENDKADVFWNVVQRNLEDFDILIDSLVKEYKTDKNRIALAGHSMGGITSAGIFARNSIPKTMVIMNGTGNWGKSNDIFVKTLGIKETERLRDLEIWVEKNDPFARLDFMKDRPILILHGEDDSIVEIEPQREFYDSLKDLYSKKDQIMMVTYKKLGHFVTTNMMEDMADWLEKYL